MNDHQVLPYCVQVYWEEEWCMSWSECCGCAMAFYAACQWQWLWVLFVFTALSKSLISQLTGAVNSLTGLLFDLTMTSIENLLLQTHLIQNTCALNPTSTLYRTVRNIANIDRPSFIAELSSVSEFSSVENANQFCEFLRTVLDKHAPLLCGRL